MSKPLKYDYPPPFQLEFFVCLMTVLAGALSLGVIIWAAA